jgi:hypothetical protein
MWKVRVATMHLGKQAANLCIILPTSQASECTTMWLAIIGTCDFFRASGGTVCFYVLTTGVALFQLHCETVPIHSGESPLAGNRYKCDPVAHCRDYDLCESCFREPSLAALRAHHGRFVRITDEIQSSANVVTCSPHLPQVVDSLLHNYSPLPFVGQWVSGSRGRSVKFTSFGDVFQRARYWQATVSRHVVQHAATTTVAAFAASSDASATSIPDPSMPKRPAVVLFAHNSVDWVVVDVAALLYVPSCSVFSSRYCSTSCAQHIFESSLSFTNFEIPPPTYTRRYSWTVAAVHASFALPTLLAVVRSVEASVLVVDAAQAGAVQSLLAEEPCPSLCLVVAVADGMPSSVTSSPLPTVAAEATAAFGSAAARSPVFMSFEDAIIQGFHLPPPLQRPGSPAGPATIVFTSGTTASATTGAVVISFLSHWLFTR